MDNSVRRATHKAFETLNARHRYSLPKRMDSEVSIFKHLKKRPLKIHKHFVIGLQSS